MRKAVPCLLSFVVALVLSGAAARAAEADDARKEAAGGNYAKAIAAARAALAKAPDDLGTARLLQDLLVRVGKRDEAEQVGQEGASEETASYLRLRLGESKEAVEGFKKRRGAPGGPEWARLDLAAALLRGGNSAAAETEAKAYAKDHPQDVEGLLLLARISATRQSMAAARAPLEQALQAEPGAAGPAVFLARLLQTLNEPAAARQVLVDALAVHSTHPELRLALALDQAVVGEALSADATLEALVQELPDWAPAHGAQAQVKRILGRLPEAEASARKAVELDPGEFAGQETLGFVLLKKKDLDGALEHYGAALRIDPTRIEPYVGLGYAQALRKELKFAEDMLEKALKIDKDDVDANLKMGIVAYQKKDYRRAARHFQVVLRQDPQNLIAQRYMGYVLLQRGQGQGGAGRAQEGERRGGDRGRDDHPHDGAGALRAGEQGGGPHRLPAGGGGGREGPLGALRPGQGPGGRRGVPPGPGLLREGGRAGPDLLVAPPLPRRAAGRGARPEARGAGALPEVPRAGWAGPRQRREAPHRPAREGREVGAGSGAPGQAWPRRKLLMG